MPTKIQGGLGIDKVQDGTVGVSDVDTELYGKITALTTINLGEAKTASGTVVDFVGIPEGVKRVTVMFDGVSTNGANNLALQLGTSGRIETTGYSGQLFNATNTQAAQIYTNPSNMILLQTLWGAASTVSGSIVLELVHGNMFVITGMLACAPDTYNRMSFVGARKVLAGDLGCIRITNQNGTDQFDAGTINISWEF